MKSNKFLFLICLPLMSQLLFSCMCCDCDDDPIEIIPFESTSRDSLNLTYLDNSGEVVVESTEDSLSRKAFGIRLNRNIIYANYFEKKSSDISFFPTAKAFSCGCDNGVVQDLNKFEDFEILAITDSTEDSIVTSKFKILSFDRYSEVNLPNINSNSTIDFILTDVPDTAQFHQFLFKYTIADSSYSDTTKLLYLF